MALRLPDRIAACLFDLDGVLTDTASIHAAAWREMFDAYLQQRSKETGTPFVPFDPVADYDLYVDGKPRADGTRAFLESRGIHLDDQTIEVLGDRKNHLVLDRIRRGGVQAYPGSVQLVHEVKDAGLRRAVVSSSTNCRDVLVAAEIADLFDAVVDGLVAGREHLKGKPAPDTFLAAARMVGLPPDRCAVFEDALAGVEAGRAGGFGYVVGVDRVGQHDALREHGAAVVVTDLAQLIA